jgi:hypothetical protein
MLAMLWRGLAQGGNEVRLPQFRPNEAVSAREINLEAVS